MIDGSETDRSTGGGGDETDRLRFWWLVAIGTAVLFGCLAACLVFTGG